MTNEEKYEFYKKYQGKEIELSDDENFAQGDTALKKLEYVILGDSTFPFVDHGGVCFKYARAIQRIPKLGDKVKAWDDIPILNIPVRCYLMNIGGPYPHVVIEKEKGTDDITPDEGVMIFAYKNVEVID